MFYKIIKLLFFTTIFLSTLSYASELKKVSLQLSWFHQFQFAGYYIAKEKGFYKDAGLDVEIRPYTFDTNLPEEVSEGRADFAIDRETLLLHGQKYKNIVVLYALFQSSPLVLLSTKDSNITKVEDFVGKRLMSTIRDSGEVSVKAMINSHNVSLDDLTLLDHSHNIKDLVDKKTDIISAYISKTPFDLQEMGVEYNVFAPKDYEFDMYSDFLFTSSEFISKNKKTVNAFKEASLRGWEYAFSHIDESVELILEKYNSQNISKQALIYEANELKKLAYLNTNTLGKIQKNKIKRIYDLYKILGFIDSKIDYDRFIYDSQDYKIPLTKKQREYLAKKKVIKVCIDPNWMPFEALDTNGNYMGLNKDFLEIFQNDLQIPIEIVQSSSWGESLSFAKQRKCDVLSLSMQTQDRKNYLDFTSSYISLTTVLVTKPNIPFTDDFSTLDGKKIGVVKDYAQIELIKKRYPKIKVVEVQSMQDGFEKVVDGKIYGYIGTLSSVGYAMQDRFISQLKISAKFPFSVNLGLGIRNDDKVLFDIFEKLVTNLSDKTKDEIFRNNVSIKYEKEIDYTLVIYILISVFVIGLIFLNRQYTLKQLNKELNVKVDEKTKELQALNASLEQKVKSRTIKLEESKEKLKEMAYKDNLTQVYNRHYLFKIFDKVLKKTKEPISLLVIDIDYFKNINDTYGHLVGDEILKYLVVKIQKILRKKDIFVRYGGEEFIILLPESSLRDSLIVAEKIRETVQENPYINRDLAIALTISVGVSEYKEGDILEQLIDRADVALYEAKKRGRNQVQSYNTD